jgi:hypothetical protein
LSVWIGAPVFSHPVPAIGVYGTILNLLIGAGAIARVASRRLPYEGRRS